MAFTAALLTTTVESIRQLDIPVDRCYFESFANQTWHSEFFVTPFESQNEISVIYRLYLSDSISSRPTKWTLFAMLSTLFSGTCVPYFIVISKSHHLRRDKAELHHGR